MHLDALIVYSSAVLNIYVGCIPWLYTESAVYMFSVAANHELRLDAPSDEQNLNVILARFLGGGEQRA